MAKIPTWGQSALFVKVDRERGVKTYAVQENLLVVSQASSPTLGGETPFYAAKDAFHRPSVASETDSLRFTLNHAGGDKLYLHSMRV